MPHYWRHRQHRLHTDSLLTAGPEDGRSQENPRGLPRARQRRGEDLARAEPPAPGAPCQLLHQAPLPLHHHRVLRWWRHGQAGRPPGLQVWAAREAHRLLADADRFRFERECGWLIDWLNSSCCWRLIFSSQPNQPISYCFLFLFVFNVRWWY